MSVSVSYGGGGLAIQRSILVSSQTCAQALLFLVFVWSWRLNKERKLYKVKSWAPFIDFGLCFIIFICTLANSLHLQENRNVFGLSILCTVSSALLWLFSIGALVSQSFHMSLHQTISSSLLSGIFLISGICFCESAYIRFKASDCADQDLVYFDGINGIASSFFAALHISGFSIENITRPNRIVTSLSSEYINDSEVPFLQSLSEESIDNQTSEIYERKKHDDADLYSQFTFSFLDDLFSIGLERQLEMHDLEDVPLTDATDVWANKFRKILSDWRLECKEKSTQQNNYTKTKGIVLLILLCKTFGTQWALLGFLQAGCVAAAMVSPLLLNQLLGYLAAPTSITASSPLLGLLWVVLLVATQGFAALFTTQFCYRFIRLQLRLRAALVSAVFRTMLEAPLSVRNAIGGKVTNFLSVDVQKLQDAVPSFHQFWSLPIQVGVTIYLLATQMSWGAISGLAVLCIIVPINIVVAKRIGTMTGQMMTARDERVRITGELLSGIRVVKLQAWEISLLDRIRVARELELVSLKARKYLDAACVFFWAATPVLIAFATFASVVASLPDRGVSGGDVSSFYFTASSVFTTVSLLNLLVYPMNAFPWILTGVLEAWISLGRLESFLCEFATDTKQAQIADAPEYGKLSISSTLLLTIQGTFAFVNKDEMNDESSINKNKEDDVFNLSIENVVIERGKYLAVCGPVGSGKSAFISTLLRDAYSNSAVLSSVQLSSDCTMSYAPQKPWIRNISLRENIVFGEVFNQERYDRVIDACALNADISTLCDGDASVISEHTLSGGQMQRVGLARALYATSTLVVLDDPLSAVDTSVSLSIWKRALAPGSVGEKHSWSSFDTGTSSFLCVENRACILVSHDSRFITLCNTVLVLKRDDNYKNKSFSVYYGSISGMPQSALEKEDTFTSEKLIIKNEKEIDSQIIGTVLKNERDVNKEKETVQVDIETKLDEEKRLEAREKGAVKSAVVLTYISAVGYFLSVLIIMSLCLMQLSRISADWWLSVWSASASDSGSSSGGASAALASLLSTWSSLDFLTVYGSIALFNTLAVIVRSWSFAKGGILAAIRIHDSLLISVAFATMEFFDSTPSGRLLNRFSTDIYATDESLPFQLNILLAQVVGMAGTLLVLIYSTSGVFLIAIPTLYVVYSYIQLRYRASSRELKRLDSTSRSPVFTHFSECQIGSSIIRAHSIGKKERSELVGLHPTECSQLGSAIDREHVKSIESLNTSQRTSFSMGVAGQWLALRLQAIGAVIVFLVAFVSVLVRVLTDTSQAIQGDDGGCLENSSSSLGPSSGVSGGGDAAAAGTAGLSLSYAIPIVGALQGLISTFTDTEKEMVSVERCKEYTDLPSEEESMDDNTIPDKAFDLFEKSASLGAVVEFINVTSKYPGTLRSALSDISIKIHAGSKVGICGRTGSGKSTFLSLLHRLAPLVSGSIQLDGLDSRNFRLGNLRRLLTVIPQEPLLFSGTIRFNLDPTSKYKDADIVRALETCHIFASLEDQVNEGGKNWSVGERQLLCLARALLKKSRIVCIDEATAATDSATDLLIQGVLSCAFKGATMFIIAHRVSTLLSCDRVLVLSDGKIVEDGTPTDLEKMGGRFSKLLLDGSALV
jgi:ATP-binding cassette, subfamily C (CFTR/MRP), member 10